MSEITWGATRVQTDRGLGTIIRVDSLGAYLVSLDGGGTLLVGAARVKILSALEPAPTEDNGTWVEAWTIEPGATIAVTVNMGEAVNGEDLYPGDPTDGYWARVRAVVAVSLNPAHGATGNGVQLVLDTPDRDTITLPRWERVYASGPAAAPTPAVAPSARQAAYFRKLAKARAERGDA